MNYCSWDPILLGRHNTNQLDILGIKAIYTNSHPSFWAKTVEGIRIGIGMPPTEEILHRCRALNPDLIHAHFGTDGVDIYPLAKRLNVPLVITLHGHDISVRPTYWHSGKGGIRRCLYPEQLKNICYKNVHFIAVSTAIKKIAIERGIPKEKISVNYTGVDLDQLHPMSNFDFKKKKDIVFVGRLVEKKGVRYLITALQILLRQVPDVRLHIVGDGEERNNLHKLATNLNIINSIDFHGVMPPTEVFKLVSSARVFCLPSVTAKTGDCEGLGMVLLEAQALGTPVVTSATGGTEDAVIHGKTGFCFAERDIAKLAEYLLQITTKDELARAMSIAGARFVESKFDIRQCTQNLEIIYDRLIGERKFR